MDTIQLHIFLQNSFFAACLFRTFASLFELTCLYSTSYVLLKLISWNTTILLLHDQCVTILQSVVKEYRIKFSCNNANAAVCGDHYF
jgi:hypothetical protein